MSNVPETPEGAAVFLLCLLLEHGAIGAGDNRPLSAQILDLFSQCLRAANGGDVSHGPAALH